MRSVPASMLVVFVFSILSGLANLTAHHGPDKLVFKAKTGNVTFDHAKHVERMKGDCKSCHPKLWPQSKAAPLNFKAGMHKPAEAKQASCGACHYPGGTAFESKGNCNKCHVKG